MSKMELAVQPFIPLPSYCFVPDLPLLLCFLPDLSHMSSLKGASGQYPICCSELAPVSIPPPLSRDIREYSEQSTVILTFPPARFTHPTEETPSPVFFYKLSCPPLWVPGSCRPGLPGSAMHLGVLPTPSPRISLYLPKGMCEGAVGGWHTVGAPKTVWHPGFLQAYITFEACSFVLCSV